jgi:Ser/Thr protein kinase RdoA (MazF antagonist)
MPPDEAPTTGASCDAVPRVRESTGLAPVTVNHGDLHPGNVFSVNGDLRLFDFGDAQWAAAPEVLGPPCAC